MSQSSVVDAELDAAIASHQARDLDRAEQLYRNVLRADPHHAEALSLLGVILQDRGAVDESIELISRALEVDPDYPDALANIARGFNLAGQPERASEAARKAAELDPSLGEAWLQLGRAAIDLRHYQEALDALREATAHFPRSVEINAGIAYSAYHLGLHDVAAEAYQIVLEIQPDKIDALVNLGATYCQLDRLDEALAAHRKAAAIAPDDATALAALAATLHRLHEPVEFVPVCHRFLNLAPPTADVLMILASGQMWLGHLDAAVASCEAALRLNPDHIAARQLLARLKPDTLDDRTVALFREQLNDTSIPVHERAPAGFAIATALDTAGDFDAAFKMYQASNTLYREAARAAGKVYDADEFRSYVDWCRTQFTPARFAEFRALGSTSELPVFVVGLPRSGTSLIEQIAASHPRVFGAGELLDVADMLKRINKIPAYIPLQQWDREQPRLEAGQYVSRLKSLGGDVDRVIDKMPDNVKALGQIRVLFPDARIIICHRDLRDVCVSCFTTPFGEGLTWALDIEDCARQAVETRRLMDHWRQVLPGPVLEISYEALVADMEAESRRLIAFLGLDWDPACLEFHQTERTVTTASALQVRQPIYTSSIGKWRRYEAHLGPMLRILGESGASPSGHGSAITPEAEVLRDAAAASGQPALAIEVLRAGALRFPYGYDIHADLGRRLTENGKLEEAIRAWRQASSIQPGNAVPLANLGVLLTKVGNASEGATILRRAATLQPRNPKYLRALASATWELKDMEGTRAAYHEALANSPEDEDTLLALANFETLLGRFDVAAAHYRRILVRNPGMIAARLGLLTISDAQDAGDLAGLRSALDDPGQPQLNRIKAGFALGKALDTAGDYDGAFSAFRAANSITRPRGLPDTPHGQGTDIAALANRLTEAFQKEVFQATTGWGDQSDLPVFIVGVLRSGTSLVEQILASHAKVYGAGECTDIFPAVNIIERSGIADCPTSWNPMVVKREAMAKVARLRDQGGDATRVIDKLPGNVFWLGHIRMMLPTARIIICRRDPRDIGLSCYSTYFSEDHGWTNGLADIATQIRETDRIIAHWRKVLPGPVMELQYEHLVGNLETESRRLVEFLDLDWDASCLEFFRTERAVTTASVWQVRQKIYTNSIGRWRNYERHLGPLLEGLRGIPPSNDSSAERNCHDLTDYSSVSTQ